MIHRELPRQSLRPEKQGLTEISAERAKAAHRVIFRPTENDALPDGKDGEYLPERLADEAIAFVTESREEPFFLNWWPFSVHYWPEGDAPPDSTSWDSSVKHFEMTCRQ